MKVWKRRILLLFAIGLLTLVCSTFAFASRHTRHHSRSNWSSRAGVNRHRTAWNRHAHTKTTRVASSSTGDAMIDKALACRGTRYIYGGTSRGGFDCSGFTRYVYSRFGIALPRTSDEQYNIGTPVSRGELKPGDLLFFSTIRAGVSHVGIYIGNGKMVHAANPRRGVTTDSIYSSYYASRFVGARRVK